MREKPIIFNSEMVRAVLENRKTQTRRVIKKQPKYATEIKCEMRGGNLVAVPYHRGAGMLWNEEAKTKCPYGKVGDRLWVRETWRIYHGSSSAQLYWKATPDLTGVQCQEKDYKSIKEKPAWRPSIHMSRWMSRINLEITDIRVEKVQDITNDDCQREGLKILQGGILANFAVLWNQINAKRGLRWAVNPWVWVIEFKRI